MIVVYILLGILAVFLLYTFAFLPSAVYSSIPRRNIRKTAGFTVFCSTALLPPR